MFKKLAQTSILDETTELLKQTADKCIGHNKDHDEYMKEIFAYYDKTSVISRPALMECFAILDQVQNLIQNANTELKNRLGSIGVAEITVYVRNLKAHQRHSLSRFTYNDQAMIWLWRDSAMAQNVLDFWNAYQKQKSIFLAHTSHVAKKPASFVTNTDPIVPAGVYLSQAMGKKYKTIGFTGYDTDGVQGDFTAPTANDSLDNVLHKLSGFDFAWIDTSKEKFNRLWWIQNENGGEGSYPDGVNLNPSTHYDAMVFVDRSEASKTIEPEESKDNRPLRPLQTPHTSYKEPKTQN